jgi:hypothetical protein
MLPLGTLNSDEDSFNSGDESGGEANGSARE